MQKLFFYIVVLATALTWVATAQTRAGQIHQPEQMPLCSRSNNQYYCIAGSVGIPGVQMTGLPGGVVSDASGHYQALIKKDAQPMVIPRKEGFEFTPKGKIYNHVYEDLTQQNYQCKPATYVISGSIGHANVRLQGFPKPATTDQYGNFSAVVPHGWQACVSPSKEGFEFTPSEIHFSRIAQDKHDQNFTAHFKTVTLSGAIIVGHCPMSGVSVSTNFGGGADTTDELGRFFIEVPYGWTGDITPYKKGYSFNPPCLGYTNVKDDFDSIAEAPRMGELPAQGARLFFDVAHRAASEHVASINRTLLPALSKSTHNSTQVRDNLRVAAAIMDERLGAFATHTQGIYVQDYGIIFHSQVRPAFTFQGFPQATQPSCASDHHLDLLRENTLKLIAHTAHVKILDPRQWVVVTLAVPNPQGREHAITLQARKSDVDAFAAQEITMQEFKRRVQITVQ
ncbi:MAG: hypothetical protein GY809_30200 [Planctomycetes bacterium]|nr:hypothetical protein [Planctomycetota bacterium]